MCVRERARPIATATLTLSLSLSLKFTETETETATETETEAETETGTFHWKMRPAVGGSPSTVVSAASKACQQQVKQEEAPQL